MLTTLRHGTWLWIWLVFTSALAEPPSYRMELLDTGQFDAPSAQLPAGGYLAFAAFVSPNGRYVVTGVADNQDADPVPRHLARLDRATGTAELISGFDRPLPVGINDAGAIALVADGASPGAVRETFFWSPALGAVPFGETSLAATFVSHGAGTGFPRVLNNAGQVLVTNDAEESVLWDPTASTRSVIELDAGAPGVVTAVSLNNLGQVVGAVSFPTGLPNEIDVRPFIWDQSSGLRILLDLELISPNVSPFITFGRFATANAINDAGVIAGETWDETRDLLGLHWDSEATLPTLRPCETAAMSLPPNPVFRASSHALRFACSAIFIISVPSPRST